MDFLNYQFTQLTFVLAVATGGFLLLQLIYYVFVYGKVSRYRLPEENYNFPPVSVVLVTKDEQENLKERLPVILEQQYPDFEVVIVNNASSDETEFVLKVFQKIYPQLKVVNLYSEAPNKFLGKKYPLSIGIKSAKNDCVLLTNVNCVPNSLFWIMNMVRGLSQTRNTIIGFNFYEREKTLFNSLVQYDTIINAINYGGMALLGNPYKATGDNIIISREEFFNSGSFLSLYNVACGDMELYVNRITKGKKTSVILNEEAYIKTETPQSFSLWCRYKKRNIKTAYYYKFLDKLLVAIPSWTTLFFYATFVTLFLLNFPWQWILTGCILKFAIQIIFFQNASKVLMKNNLCIFAPLFEIFFLVFNTIMGISVLFSRKDRWE
jgi:glycosyltransferase involved in cell wall biosynthesis